MRSLCRARGAGRGGRLVVLALCLGTWSAAAELHIVIPAGPGGGLDGLARETGRVLKELDLVERVSFENMSGGGGGRAMAYFLENATRFESPLLVNSTPLLVRSLQGMFPYGFRDLTPVAALIADPSVFVVRPDSAIDGWPALLAKLREAPGSVTFGGGSVRGSLDHIALALALQAGGLEPRQVRYLPYDGGGKAMLALLGGEVDVLSTGFGETVAFLDAGQARGLAVTAPQRLAAAGDTPTLKELGFDVVFTNWRGLFGPPGMAPDKLARHVARLRAMRESEAWRTVLDARGWTSLTADSDEFSAFLGAQEAQLDVTLRTLGFIE